MVVGLILNCGIWFEATREARHNPNSTVASRNWVGKDRENKLKEEIAAIAVKRWRRGSVSSLLLLKILPGAAAGFAPPEESDGPRLPPALVLSMQGSLAPAFVRRLYILMAELQGLSVTVNLDPIAFLKFTLEDLNRERVLN